MRRNLSHVATHSQSWQSNARYLWIGSERYALSEPIHRYRALLANDHRLRDWALLKTIDSAKPWNVADLREASNWLQRKLAERTRSPEALAVLAEHGRTNRIRTLARSRLDQRTA